MIQHGQRFGFCVIFMDVPTEKDPMLTEPWLENVQDLPAYSTKMSRLVPTPLFWVGVAKLKASATNVRCSEMRSRSLTSTASLSPADRKEMVYSISFPGEVSPPFSASSKNELDVGHLSVSGGRAIVIASTLMQKKRGLYFR